jgi:hypothetical protein
MELAPLQRLQASRLPLCISGASIAEIDAPFKAPARHNQAIGTDITARLIYISGAIPWLRPYIVVDGLALVPNLPIRRERKFNLRYVKERRDQLL